MIQRNTPIRLAWRRPWVAAIPFMSVMASSSHSNCIRSRNTCAFVHIKPAYPPLLPRHVSTLVEPEVNGLVATEPEPLPPEKLRWICDPSVFDFETTSDLADLESPALMIGQERAESSMDFGVSIKRDGYNVYVMGPSGIGKRTLVQNYLKTHVLKDKTATPPSDWCYVNNFEDSDNPKTLCLPAGMGQHLSVELEQFIEDVKVDINAALTSQEHRQMLQKAEKEIFKEYEHSMEVLGEEAKAQGLDMVRSSTGVALVIPEDPGKLTSDQRKEIESKSEELQPKIRETVQKLPQVLNQARAKIKELNQEAVREVIEASIAPLKKKFADLEDVVKYLNEVERDIVEHYNDFHPEEEGGGNLPPSSPLFPFLRKRTNLDKYKINVLVDHSETEGGAPVIYEDHPHYHNLMGRIEHESHLGSLRTDFTLIKPGALHKANGGYLVMRAKDVLLQPFSWDALKRALRTKSINTETLFAELSLISTVSLQPDPIPLDVKVILVGDRLLYYLLQQYDKDFSELFKVAVDFNDQTDSSPHTLQLYARMLATISKNEGTRPMTSDAVALMIEQAARQAADQEKISTHMLTTTDLLRESDYWAGVEESDYIASTHVEKAIQHQIYRADRIRELIYEQIRRRTLLVDVTGSQTAQVNGLSVLSLGDLSFGRPSRITATARLGSAGKVLDIEREVQLGGSIHSKGVMILSSLLASRYAKNMPLSLSASLVFEQSYGMVEGDSASMAELCALLSALSNLPIRQDLAITGSVNQRGEAQPIGGVNEKIEGFYDVCQAVGLTGSQGVLIPESNAKHLMLRTDVVRAAQEKKFFIYTYRNVDEAMALLTGVEAGVPDEEGGYLPGTVNFHVNRRLQELSDLALSFAKKANDSEEDK